MEHAEPLNHARALRAVARRVYWWKTPAAALANPTRFACQVMVYGTWDDVVRTRSELGDATFIAGLRSAPPGVFDARSWNYWHHVYGLTPVPPLPTRVLE